MFPKDRGTHLFFCLNLLAGILFLVAALFLKFTSANLPLSFLNLGLQSFAAFSVAILVVFPQSSPGFLEKLKRPNRSSVLLGLAALLTIFFAWINQTILLRFFHSADEFSCYFFSNCLLKGRWWAESFPMAEAVAIPHIGDLEGKRFSVYPPGWPLVWALALKLHLGDWINPILSGGALGLWGSFLWRHWGWKIAVWTVLLSALSPFFSMTSAAYYSHSLCFFLWVLFLLAMEKWFDNRRIRWAVLAGGLLGFGLMVRYLTMAALSLPFIGVAAWMLVRTFPRELKSALAFLGTAAFFCFLHVFYNFQITGSFFDFPNHFARSHEKLGFILDYTPWVAFDYLWRRFVYLMDWTPPLLVVLSFVGMAAGFSRKPRWERMLWGAFGLVPAGYFFYYSWGGNQFGPRYYYEAYPILVLFAVLGMNRLVAFCSPPLQKGLFFRFACMITLFSLPVTAHWFGEYKKITAERKKFFDAAEKDLAQPALVFVSGFLGDTLVMSAEDALRNDPWWENPVIYALDLGETANKKLRSLFPSRQAYEGSFDRKSLTPHFRPLPKKEMDSPVDSSRAPSYSYAEKELP